jgi:hypothetical protein
MKLEFNERFANQAVSVSLCFQKSSFQRKQLKAELCSLTRLAVCLNRAFVHKQMYLSFGVL